MTPLILLTGFLGAGKTTFLRRLLLDARAQNRSVGVIINEFGAVDVDSELVRDAARSLASIAGGCACCSGQDDFVEAVQTMSDGAFDAVIIEASGLADPLILLENLAAPALLKRARVSQILCVADAAAWNASASALGPLMRRQLALADTIILNKTDLITPAALAALARKLAALNPDARLQFSVEGEVAPPPDFGPRATSMARAASSVADALSREFERHASPPIAALENAPLSDALHAASHTVWVPLPHPLDGAALARALDELGAEIWRAKGFVRVRGQGALQLVQLTGGPDGNRHRIAPFAPPFGAPEPTLGLVFIGAQLDESALQRQFGALSAAF